MVPHHVVQGTRSSVERRKVVASPGHRVGNAPRAQPVDLGLVPVGEGVPQLDQVLILGSITATVRRRPSTTGRLQSSRQSTDAEPPEVLLEAANIGVTTVDEPSLRCGRSEERSELCRGIRQVHEALGREIVEIPHEGLELGDNAKDIRVCDRTAELSRAPGPVHLAHCSVRGSQRVDGITARL